MSDLDPAGLEAAAKALQADRGAPTTHAGRYDSHRATVAVRAYLAAVLPPDEENRPDVAGIEAAKQAVYESMPVVLKDLVSRSEAEAAIGVPHGAGVPDHWIADVAVRAYLAAGRAAASPDERLREAGEQLANLVTLLGGYDGPGYLAAPNQGEHPDYYAAAKLFDRIMRDEKTGAAVVLAQWRAALAAVDQEAPDEET